LAVRAGALAIPPALVIAVAAADPEKAALAPVPDAVNVTVTLLTGLLLVSFTAACSAVAKAVFIVALWGVPKTAATLAGGPGRFVKLKLAGVATLGALAVTVKLPAWELAVKAGAAAIPLALVAAVAVADPLNEPVAPVVGAAKVTVTPLSGLLLPSFTVACKAVVNAAFTVAL
jgi:hypothetical protein